MFSRYFKQIFGSMFHHHSWRKGVAFSMTTATWYYCISYPIKLYPISTSLETNKPSSIHRNIDLPLLFTLQLQLDSTVSFINQLLKEFQILIINMEHLTVEYNQLQSVQNDIDPDSDSSSSSSSSGREIDELLLEIRSQWSTLMHQLDNAEIVIRSSINTLRHSLETAFLCEEYLKTTITITTTTTSSRAVVEATTTGQSSLSLYHIEQEFTSLVDKRKEIFQLWTNQIAEHIKQFGKS